MYIFLLAGIFKVALSHDKLGISKDVMANKVLPFLIPLSIDSNLNFAQVSDWIGLLKPFLCVPMLVITM